MQELNNQIFNKEMLESGRPAVVLFKDGQLINSLAGYVAREKLAEKVAEIADGKE